MFKMKQKSLNYIIIEKNSKSMLEIKDFKMANFYWISIWD